MITNNEIKTVVEIATTCSMNRGSISDEEAARFLSFSNTLGEPSRDILELVIGWGGMDYNGKENGPFSSGFNSPLVELMIDDTNHNIRKYPLNQFRTFARSSFLVAKETKDLELLITAWTTIQVVLYEDDSIKFNSIKKTANDFLLYPKLTRYDKLVRWFRNL